MSNIKAIKTTRDQWSDDAVQTLRNSLAEAESSPHESVVVLMVGRDGEIKTYFSSSDMLQLLGAIEYAKSRIIEG